MSTTAVPPPVPLNRRLKRWPGWVVLLGVVIVALLIGSTRSSGPLTDGDRLDSIGQHLACPVCEGESVYESQSPAAENIRLQIMSLIKQGTYSDDQIIQYVETNFGANTQLVPKATGFDAIVWALPVFAGVCAIAGLTVAFRRWKRAADTVPTEQDRVIVDAALREQDDEP
ncbi:MAG: ccmH [Ilumatobacteraceae bacterium]|nr:ccmH [Ilumatobacteraceae bacterium]